MSQKQSKELRRNVSKMERRIEGTIKFTADEMVREMAAFPLKLRLQYAVFLITGWWKPKEASDGADT